MSEDDDDEEESIQRQVLPVDSLRWTDEILKVRIAEGPPASADEYLGTIFSIRCRDSKFGRK